MTKKMTTLDFTKMTKITKNKRDKKPFNELKQSNNFQFNPQSQSFRLFNDFSTTIQQIDNKDNHRFTPYIENNLLYLHREPGGFTIKNTQHQTEKENYFQLPKGLTSKLNLIQEDKKIQIDKIDDDTFRINLDEITIKQ